MRLSCAGVMSLSRSSKQQHKQNVRIVNVMVRTLCLVIDVSGYYTNYCAANEDNKAAKWILHMYVRECLIDGGVADEQIYTHDEE